MDLTLSISQKPQYLLLSDKIMNIDRYVILSYNVNVMFSSTISLSFFEILYNYLQTKIYKIANQRYSILFTSNSFSLSSNPLSIEKKICINYNRYDTMNSIKTLSKEMNYFKTFRLKHVKENLTKKLF